MATSNPTPPSVAVFATPEWGAEIEAELRQLRQNNADLEARLRTAEVTRQELTNFQIKQQKTFEAQAKQILRDFEARLKDTTTTTHVVDPDFVASPMARNNNPDVWSQIVLWWKTH